MTQRIVGVELAITSKHKAIVMDEKGVFVVNIFAFERTSEGFEYLLKKCLPKDEPNAKLIFIMEPTSNTWLPLCCYLIEKRAYGISDQPSKSCCTEKIL